MARAFDDSMTGSGPISGGYSNWPVKPEGDNTLAQRIFGSQPRTDAVTKAMSQGIIKLYGKFSHPHDQGSSEGRP